MTKRHPFDILTVSSCCSVEVYVCNFLKVIKLWLFLLEKHLLQNCSQMKQSAYKSPFCSKTLFTCWILFSQKRSPDWSYLFCMNRGQGFAFKKKVWTCCAKYLLIYQIHWMILRNISANLHDQLNEFLLISFDTYFRSKQLVTVR